MKNIEFTEAKAIAEESAERNLRVFCEKDSASLLSEKIIEKEHCWVFFRNKSIRVPNERSMEADWSYAVSKYGEIREFYDIPDPDKMNEAVEKLSEHFGKKREYR